MIRPELRVILRRWAEPLAAAAALLAALWLALRGGWFFAAIGLTLAAVVLVWGVGAIRRLRFAREIAAPGFVELDEGAIRYLGARMLGGEIALRDLSEIRLLRLNGAPFWRLKTLDGQALLVPLEAAGAERMADAFAVLPGLDMGTVAHALAQVDRDGPAVVPLWRRPAGSRVD